MSLGTNQISSYEDITTPRDGSFAATLRDYGIHEIIFLFSAALTLIGSGVDLTVSIFLGSEFTKPNSKLKTPYFFMVLMGFQASTVASFLRALGVREMENDTLFAKIVIAVRWWSQNALGIWIFFMGINRCTAMSFPMHHTRVS